MANAKPKRILGGFAVACVAAVWLGAGCGDDAVCGNGAVESGEACDDGLDNGEFRPCSAACTQNNTLDAQIIWTLIGTEFEGFGESCGGVMADDIRLEITGAMTFTETLDCNFSQTIFRALIPGDYSIRATLLDSAGTAITSGMASAPFTITTADDLVDVVVNLDFPFADFLGSYMGNFFFRVDWAGADTCAGAMPPVVEHVFTLERGGTPLPGLTDVGDPIDGSGPGPCRDGNTEFAQKVNDQTWGPATFTIVGLDSTGTPQFRKTFETFVGAGVSNPDITFSVDSLAPDAAPLPPDAGPVDAGLPDAMP